MRDHIVSLKSIVDGCEAIDNCSRQVLGGLLGTAMLEESSKVLMLLRN